MKRYYMVPPGHLPHERAETPSLGEYHYLDLADSHRVLVLFDQSKIPPTTWEPLPHLLDPATTLSHPKHVQHLARLSAVGAKPDHSGFALAKHLATIHPAFEP